MSCGEGGKRCMQLRVVVWTFENSIYVVHPLNSFQDTGSFGGRILFPDKFAAPFFLEMTRFPHVFKSDNIQTCVIIFIFRNRCKVISHVIF